MTKTTDDLSTVNGITSLSTARDHPRLVQYAPTVARYWGANSDVQVLLYALDDLPEEIPNVEEYMQELIRYYSDNADFLSGLKEVYNSRNYFSKQSALESLINYIIAYARMVAAIRRRDLTLETNCSQTTKRCCWKRGRDLRLERSCSRATKRC